MACEHVRRLVELAAASWRAIACQQYGSCQQHAGAALRAERCLWLSGAGLCPPSPRILESTGRGQWRVVQLPAVFVVPWFAGSTNLEMALWSCTRLFTTHRSLGASRPGSRRGAAVRGHPPHALQSGPSIAARRGGGGLIPRRGWDQDPSRWRHRPARRMGDQVQMVDQVHDAGQS
jgi:hypothetical protein